jgi:hypothetical protein
MGEGWAAEMRAARQCRVFRAGSDEVHVHDLD